MTLGLRQRKILQIGKYYPPEHGGMESHLANLCQGLSQYFDISVLVANRNRVTQRESVGPINVVRAGRWMNIAGAPLCPVMPWFIRQMQPDLIHLHVPNPGGVISLILSNYRGPLVVTYHSDVLRQGFLIPIFQPVLDRTLSQSRAIIATSQTYIETSPVLKRFSQRCRVIPLGIDIGACNPRTAELATEIKQTYPGPIVLAVGRLVYYKGFEYLIHAMQDIQATLLVIGEGPLRASLEALVVEYAVSERVKILGSVPNVEPYMEAADVFVLPSIARTEAFGLVQLEAMVRGKPVVNTNIPSGVPFVSPHQISGLTVLPRDPAALAEAINQLLACPELRRRYGQAGRKRVEDEFSIASMVRQTMVIYEAVLEADVHRGDDC